MADMFKDQERIKEIKALNERMRIRAQMRSFRESLGPDAYDIEASRYQEERHRERRLRLLGVEPPRITDSNSPMVKNKEKEKES